MKASKARKKMKARKARKKQRHKVTQARNESEHVRHVGT